MLKGFLPMPPDEGPPLPRGLGLKWPGMEVTKLKLRELIEEVPDEDDPDILSYWVQADDKMVYLEGWSDKCLAGTGFPPMEEGETALKIAYIEDLTLEITKRKAKERRLRLLEGGFVETPDAENLYGVTYGVYEKVT